MSIQNRNYLATENSRNHQFTPFYTRLLKEAFQCHEVLIVHHLTFHIDGMDANEIPSIDTLLFDHDIMKRVFGPDAVPVMTHLAAVPVLERDELAQQYFDEHIRRREVIAGLSEADKVKYYGTGTVNAIVEDFNKGLA